ncbi:MAG: CBS domain-containing protein [Planctomycetota bacterium]|jgi:CBS domain-containing protein
MLKAKDIMTKGVVSVGRRVPILEAMELLLENKIAGIPVVEEDGDLAGILTEKDLLGLYHAPEQGKDKTVEDYMTQPAVHFDEDEGLDDICTCLLEVTFRRVPVTSNGKVVGIISRPDVLKAILEECNKGVEA